MSDPVTNDYKVNLDVFEGPLDLLLHLVKKHDIPIFEVPVAFITGPAKSLFVPLGMAVVFAMLTSYMLSRTLVPTMVHYLLESEVWMYGGVEQEGLAHSHYDPVPAHLAEKARAGAA